MSDVAVDPVELGRSLEFFENPHSYGRFDIDRDYHKMQGCIDPRDEETASVLPVIVQTAGGPVGTGADTAIAVGAVERRPVSIEEGMDIDAATEHPIKRVGHRRCALIRGLVVVTNEMAEPSDQTRDTMLRWARIHPAVDYALQASGVLTGVQDGAKWMRDSLLEKEETDEEREVALLDHVDKLHPTPNIATMVGENQAWIHVTNHHPFVGLDRESKHRRNALVVQGYHDSLGATLGDTLASHGDRETLPYRLVACLARTAAVRTVLGGAHEDTVYLEVGMTKSGLTIAQVDN